MMRRLVGLAIVAAVVALLWARRRTGRRAAPVTWPPELDLPGRHVAAAREAAADFDAVFQTTFRDAVDGPSVVRALFARRALARTALADARMRLPNDLRAEQRLARAAEDLDRRMMEHIEDARQRLGAQGVHPGPLDDAWYGQWYRAANDVVA